MRAVTYTEYGSPDVLRITEAPTPVPSHDEVLVKVRAASVNPLDWRLMRGRPWFIRFMIGGLRRPGLTRTGADLAGRVEAVGPDVTQFKPGDEVFGGCRGAFADYVCAPEGKLALRPPSVTCEDAAAVPVAALTALQGLRDHGRIQRGHKVVIDGASGGVGTFAIQIARSFGADVTAVCSTGNVDQARALGADHVIDYAREDFTRSALRYDLILAANAHRSIVDYRRALAPNGIYVIAGGGWPQLIQGMALGPLFSRLGRRQFRFFMADVNTPDLDLLGGLLVSGTMVPVIERRYPLSEVAEAIRYLEQGHARGKVVIRVEQDNGG